MTSPQDREYVGYTPEQLRAKRRHLSNVLARVNARVLDALHQPAPDTIPVCIVDRRCSRGVVTVTFGRGSHEATSICVTPERVRLERQETFRGKVLLQVWVEIPVRVWSRLVQKAGILLETIYGFGPPTTPMPPAPPAPPFPRK